jgi:hypothetical protein
MCLLWGGREGGKEGREGGREGEEMRKETLYDVAMYRDGNNKRWRARNQCMCNALSSRIYTNAQEAKFHANDNNVFALPCFC